MLRKFRQFLTGIRGVHPGYPVLRPMDTHGLEILADLEFQCSCREIHGLTLLDTPRLANLWMLSRMTNPAGAMIEVGSFKGGGALHLSNGCPDRKIIVCDSFQGFRELDPQLDRNFHSEQFKETERDSVDALFQSRGRRHQVIAGFFPQSCEHLDLGPISFVHLDVDVYKSTLESLEYLAGLLIERSLMVLDDYNRRADGVNLAVQQFVQRYKAWVTFPIFPGQALLAHKSWFEA